MNPNTPKPKPKPEPVQQRETGRESLLLSTLPLSLSLLSIPSAQRPREFSPPAVGRTPRSAGMHFSGWRTSDWCWLDDAPDNEDTSGSNSNNNSNNNIPDSLIAKQPKKEEQLKKEEPKKEEPESTTTTTTTSAAAAATSAAVVKSEGSPNNINDDNGYDYSDWTTGNWCWLPPLPPSKPSASLASAVTKKECADPNGNRNRNSNSNSKNDSNIPFRSTLGQPKKEEPESTTSSAPAPALVKSEGSRDNDNKATATNGNNNYNGNDNGYDYSDWTTGSWCWLPPLPSSSTAAAAAANRPKTERASPYPIPVAARARTRTRKTPRYRPSGPGRGPHRSLCADTDDDEDEEDCAGCAEYDDDDEYDDDEYDDDEYDDNEYDGTFGDDSSDNGESTDDESHMELEDYEVESSDDESKDTEHQSSDRGLEEGGIATNGASESVSLHTHIQNARWKAKFQLLVQYKNTHGTTRIPQRHSSLGRWTHRQRCIFKRGEISEERMTLLESIGFDWDLINNAWDEMYQRLVAYKNKHGTTMVPVGYKADPKLGNWVTKQRSQCKRKDRIDQLNKIEFVWDGKQEESRRRWEVMYHRLVAYKNKHGTTMVPYGYKANPKLGTWVFTQRRCCVLKERVDWLNKIGFVWDGKEESRRRWEVMYHRLVAYKNKHGTTMVPYGYKADPKLGVWVYTQRDECTLKERMDRLNKIGFDWNFKEESSKNWEIMFWRLVSYKRKHKNTCVPQRYKADPKLAIWVTRQRQHCRKQDRIDRLNDIGFAWTPGEIRDRKWEVMYQRLVDYKRKHNNTRVRKNSKSDPQLAGWVYTQRKLCKRKDRIDRLNAIGFVWDARNQHGAKQCRTQGRSPPSQHPSFSGDESTATLASLTRLTE